MKKLILANVIVMLIAGLAVIFFIDGSSDNVYAQNAKPRSNELKIATANFSMIMKKANDILLLQDLIKLINNQQQKIAQGLEKELKDINTDMETLREEGDIDSQDYIDLEKKYLGLLAKFASLKDVYDFKRKSVLLAYSKKFLTKILKKISTYSESRCDIVYKVVDPTAKELESMSDVMQLDLIKTKEILYYNKNKITNITKFIIRLLNIDKDKEVTKALKNDIAKYK